MKLKSVEIENYRAIEHLRLPLDPSLTVLHGGNTRGKTSVLSAIALGLGAIPKHLPGNTGVDFLETDLRKGARWGQVALTTTDEIAWKCRRAADPSPVTEVTEYRDISQLQVEMTLISHAGTDVSLPIVAFYDTERSAFDVSGRPSTSRPRRYAEQAVKEEMAARIGRSRGVSRYAVLEGALTPRINFSELFTWFYGRENDELREQKKRDDFDYRLNDLSAVRLAIKSMLDGVSEPRVETEPLRFSVSVVADEGRADTLELDQLSDGQRAVLALAADLARRMAQGNPHLDDPLQSEAVVLIDEVELHLHPSWQQRILTDLRRTFPNTQFIVSTHSPQVLTTVEPRHIVELAREDGRIVAGSAAGWTFGAEAGDVLSAVMGVDQRPDNDFTRKLACYRRLISYDKGESEEALALRRELNELSADDPALDRADIEIRRRKRFREMGKST